MRILFSITWWLVFTISAIAADRSAATNWPSMDFGAFSFQAPPGMTNVPVRGIDSLVGQCVSSNIILNFDYGWYSGGSFKGQGMWKDYPRFKLVETTIDGRAAEIVSYQESARTGQKGKTNVFRVQFPKVGKDGRTSLSMTTYCQSEEDYAIARRIFESIRFKSK